MAKLSLKDQVLEVSQDYLGPAAERFVDRQIATHIGKTPDTLTNDDLRTLLDWFKLSFALLTKDSALVDEYIRRLNLVAQGKPQEAIGEQWNRE
jgi:hypothetical protein